MIAIDEVIKTKILALINSGALAGVTADNVFTSPEGVTEFVGENKIYVLLQSVEKPLTIGTADNHIATVLVVIISASKTTAYSLDEAITPLLGGAFDRDTCINTWVEGEIDYSPLFDGQRFSGDYQIARTYTLDFAGTTGGVLP